MGAAAVPLLLLLLLAVAVLLLLRLRRRHTTSARARPRNHCPYPNPILGNAVPLICNFHRFLDWATDLLAAAPASCTVEVRGPLGLGNGVATADPGVVDHILRANFPNYVKGARFADLVGRGIFVADGRLWSLQRKLASYSFSSRSLRGFTGRVVRAHLHRRLLPFLANASGEHVVVDLQDVLKRFGFDNICNVAFGVESSTLVVGDAAGDDRHAAFFKAFDDAVEISFARMFPPATAVWKAMRLAGVGSERRLREAIGVIDNYVMAMLESSESSQQSQEVEEADEHLLSRFKAAMMEEDGIAVTAYETRLQFGTLLLPVLSSRIQNQYCYPCVRVDDDRRVFGNTAAMGYWGTLLLPQSTECPLVSFEGPQAKLDWYACHPWMRYSLAVSAGFCAFIIPRPTMIISLPLPFMTE